MRPNSKSFRNTFEPKKSSWFHNFQSIVLKEREFDVVNHPNISAKIKCENFHISELCLNGHVYAWSWNDYILAIMNHMVIVKDFLEQTSSYYTAWLSELIFLETPFVMEKS